MQNKPWYECIQYERLKRGWSQEKAAGHPHLDARTIPIILCPCDWLSALEYLPYSGKVVTEWNDQNVVLSDTAQDLRHLAIYPQYREDAFSCLSRYSLDKSTENSEKKVGPDLYILCF